MRHTIAQLILTVPFAVGGCDAVKAPYPGRQDQVEDYPTVSVESRVRKALVFGRPVVTPATATTPMQIIQPLRNTSDETLHLKYHVHFLDEAGRPLNGAQMPRFMRLVPRTEQFIEASALDRRAVSYRVFVELN